MKKYISILIFFIFCSALYAQAGINTPQPNPNTYLHISEGTSTKSKAKGIILPRLTQLEIDNMAYVNPTATPKVAKLTAADNGLMVYNTTTDCFNFWNSKDVEWKTFCNKSGSLDDFEGDLGIAEFTFNCNDIFAEGNYKQLQPLDSSLSNYLMVPVTVTKEGTYTFVASTTNGFGFVTTGIFTTKGNYTIKLPGQGTPQQEGTYDLKLTVNKEDRPCTPTIQVLGVNTIGEKLKITKKMRVLAIGNWGHFETQLFAGNNTGKSIMMSPYNFGSLYNSVVDYVGWDEFNAMTNQTNFDSTMFNNTTTRADIKTKLTKTSTYKPYDIVIIHTMFGFGITTGAGTSNTEYSKIFNDYLNAGGVILMYSGTERSVTFNNTFLKEVFGGTTTYAVTAAQPMTTYGPGYPFTNIQNINLTGPFGDIRNKHWQPGYYINDGTFYGYYCNNLPQSEIVVLSTDGTPSNVMSFQHKTKNLLWVGDGNYFISTGNNKDSNNKYPLSVILPNGRVYNSVFFANNIAWALLKAQTNGINSTP